VTGLYEKCCHGDLQVTHNGPVASRDWIPEQTGFHFIFKWRQGRDKLLFKSLHCTEKYRLKVTHVLPFLPISLNFKW
jgi:hypothetical protein